MDDIISLSSGSGEDSDVEVVGVYSDTENKAEAIPFIRGGWVNLAAYTPFVIDITGRRWALPPPRRRRRRDPGGPVEVVDLSDNNLSDHSDPGPVSPLPQGEKQTEGLSKHKGPHTKSPDSLSRSPTEQELENKAVLKAEERDILESNQSSLRDSSSTGPPDVKNAVKCSDVDIPKCPVKSPSVPKSEPPAEKAKASGSSSYQITWESQQCLGITSQPLCEGKEEPECLKAKTQTSITIPNEAPTSCTGKVEKHALEEQEIESMFTTYTPLLTEEREEPGSPQSLLYATLSLSPQSLDSPYYVPDDTDPDPFRFLEDWGVHETRHNDTCYSPTHIPFESSLSPPLPDDQTVCLNQSLKQDPVYPYSSPTNGTGSVLLEEINQLQGLNRTISSPCSPSIEPDQQAPQNSQLTTGSNSPGSCMGGTHSNNESQSNRTPSLTSTVILAGESPDWPVDETDADLVMDSPLYMCSSIPSDPPMSLRSEDMDVEAGPRSPEASQSGLGAEGLMTTAWRDDNEGEEMGGERVGCENDMEVSREDRRYVCPIQLRKLRQLMAGPVQHLEDEEEEDDGFGDPEPLCRQSLSLVYSTMEENYPEGTLQLLSDLLQPRFFPPIDITTHLLRGILLDPQCPDFLCLEAYTLLMRTQRHNHTDQTTIPWDWELLTSVMAAEQSRGRRLCCEVVRMLLQYVVQTMEDDFRVKLSFRDLHHSIAKATLSCDVRFTQVRDVINWLFAAIVKSTGDKGNMSANIEVKTQKEKDEHLKMVFLLQKMLSFALEVDRSPALNSSKLSGELFHTLISTVCLRQHRMLMLETLESRLLRCKLIEHLLHHASPQKTPLPMSLSLLLHFLHNATLPPDPTDGAESWKKWEELVQLLWMLLLSYEEVMKGHLRSAVTERGGYGRAPIQTVNDSLSRLAVQEAIETFLSRAQADLGQDLPPHIHESLTYLQDHLLASSH
ncbi:SUMO-interacting motif-containing protein 1 isoform X1 [Salvelinus fontinalis]|uniref:SUMO-interacting motif-containing protein 1 isoform X1 n=1 Tax=Salvelinus fontinalis TaxID=8038 RepID=UPI0024856873|nr:SUMO-interacting motif-containing protein 1 isoform X1 [Salvelinus fontinalis]